MSDDYSQFLDTVPDDKKLNSVVELARKQWQAERRVEKLVAELDEAKKELKAVSEVDLPAAMADANLTTFSTDRVKIEIKQDHFASVPKDAQDPFCDYMIEKGNGPLVKREISVQFGMGEDHWKNLLKYLERGRKTFHFNFKAERYVHHSTLKSWVTKEIEAGHELPNTVSVHTVRKAVLSLLAKNKTETDDAIPV